MITPTLFNAIYDLYRDQKIHHVTTESDDSVVLVIVWFYDPELRQSFRAEHVMGLGGKLGARGSLNVMNRLPTLVPYDSKRSDPLNPGEAYSGISADCVAFFEREWLLKAVVSHGYVHYKTDSKVTDGEATVTLRLRLPESNVDL